jgi:nickel-dependent lactate racemase
MDPICHGGPDCVIDDAQARAHLDDLADTLGPVRRVLLIPPDHTRSASGTGLLTAHLYTRLSPRAAVTVLPALGTHAPMTPAQLAAMFPGVPATAFVAHDWREGVVDCGSVPAAFVQQVSGGRLDWPIACALSRVLVDESWDRIISLGQVVPHEVAGMAGHAKNICIGVGGGETIHKTHFLGAVCGMEAAMGRAHTPVRAVLDYILLHCLGDRPITHVLTVRGPDEAHGLVTRGLFAGDDHRCFAHAAALAARVNITLLDEPLPKVVVHLAADQYGSTWLGNKAIYRTRLALADGGEVVVLAPGVWRFGEDDEIDRLIRRFGYRGTSATLAAVRSEPELAANLAAAAHLIHGSSEGRFRITYCPGGLTRDEIEGVGYAWGALAAAEARYGAAGADGRQHTADGERFYRISHPGQGLWAVRRRFEAAPAAAGREA